LVSLARRSMLTWCNMHKKSSLLNEASLITTCMQVNHRCSCYAIQILYMVHSGNCHDDWIALVLCIQGILLFLHFLMGNARIVPQIRLWPLCCISFSYSLFMHDHPLISCHEFWTIVSIINDNINKYKHIKTSLISNT
jgi:hypothetical protein